MVRSCNEVKIGQYGRMEIGVAWIKAMAPTGKTERDSRTMLTRGIERAPTVNPNAGMRRVHGTAKPSNHYTNSATNCDHSINTGPNHL